MIQRIAVAVQRVDGRILVRRRPKNAPSYPGCWETPGGKLEPGEMWKEGCAREYREETGQPCKTGGIVGVWHHAGVTTAAFEVEAPVPPGFVPLEPGMGPLVPSLEWLLTREVQK